MPIEKPTTELLLPLMIWESQEIAGISDADLADKLGMQEKLLSAIKKGAVRFPSSLLQDLDEITCFGHKLFMEAAILDRLESIEARLLPAQTPPPAADEDVLMPPSAIRSEIVPLFIGGKLVALIGFDGVSEKRADS
jgi:hypothetical protein